MDSVPRHKRPDRVAYMKQYMKEYHGTALRAKRRAYIKSLPHETLAGYSKRYNKRHPARYLLRIAKSRAKKCSLEFNLRESDVVVPEKCPILGLHLVVASDVRGDPCSASLDRIDNSKGYVVGNVQVISLLANQMKSTANIAQLRAFARWVVDRYGR